MVYNVIEQDDRLKLAFGLAKAGLPLTRHADGLSAGPAGGLGEVVLSPSPDGTMTVRFGGRSATYRRPTGGDEVFNTFVYAAEGRYLSLETGTTASITHDDDRLTLRLSDGQGLSELEMIVLEANVAAVSGGFLATAGLGLTLSRRGNEVVGMRLDTMRTRNLAFTRITPAHEGPHM